MQLRSRPVVIGAGITVLAIIVVVGALLIVGFGRPAAQSPRASPTPSPSSAVSPTPAPAAVCPLNGEPLTKAALAQRTALSVQIENNPAARPAAGLSLADLVIEAPVEGDTTRFAAVYLCQPVIGKVGPVRSARYFNVDLWQQIHTLTLHFGAGTKILDAIAAANMPDVNGLTGGLPEFARIGPRPAPHNVYLDVNAVRAAIAAGGALADLAARTGKTRSPFVFDAQASLPAGTRVGSVTIQTNDFWRFGWKYDAASQRWSRSDGGEQIIDPLTKKAVTARSIMVQIVTETILVNELDPGGYPRHLQHLVGSGKGVLYVDGTRHAVRWERPAAADLTTWFYTDSGAPVILPPGQVWWEIVPVGTRISESP